jgi:hypothetical protein
MSRRLRALAALICVALLAGCGYIVVPPDERGPAFGASGGWTAVATSVGPGQAGALRVELAIRNETGSWSAMRASSASLVGAGGTTDCATVRVATGGHRVAPGMRLRGYVAGTKTDPAVELVHVECAGAAAEAGARLMIRYTAYAGEYNYYDPEAGRTDGSFEVNLDEVASGLEYPIAEAFEGLVQPKDQAITALNDVVVTLAGVERTDTGLEFTWQTANPGEYPTFVHIGNPPVIGADGILYGRFESPDLASVPVTPAGEAMTWTTETAVPADVGGLYILLSVESKKQRLFVNYAIDITDA